MVGFGGLPEGNAVSFDGLRTGSSTAVGAEALQRSLGMTMFF